ncbi:MAG: hypothetical protein AB7U35_02505 [Sphingobium sp.]
MEPKPFASLSAGLLARKGTARPAMRRPYIANGPTPMLPSSVQDDLGWNDLGHDDDETVETPSLTVISGPRHEAAARAEPITPQAVPAVVQQQQDLAQQIETQPDTASAINPAADLTPAPTAPRAKIDASALPRRARATKAAFTLRLDPERHLRLRLACAVGNRSAQQIVTEALDAFLDSQPQLEELAQQIPLDKGKGGKTNSK